jgi:hypothetical protein
LKKGRIRKAEIRRKIEKKRKKEKREVRAI